MTTTLTTRPVARVFPAPGTHWVGDGFKVMGYNSAYPELDEAMNPFLLLDYHPPYDYAPTSHRRGVGTHPHRGFQTVTLAFEGAVAHHDSAGNSGVIRRGDVQWMSAASGILHQEYHEEAFGRSGGTFHMAQLWVNLPASHKLSAPTYQAIEAADIPVVRLPAGTLRVIAGEFAGVSGPAHNPTPIALYEVNLDAAGEVALDLPASYNVAVLVMAGEVALNGGTRACTNELVTFTQAGERITVTAGPAARLLVLAGEPINEPVVAYGPFVMNTTAEIEQAIADYNSGKFGRMA